jgi:hypothetical protein
VAGASALLAQFHPLWGVAETRLWLQTSSTNFVGPLPNGARAGDFGTGALNVGAALAPDLVPGPNQTPDPETVRQH